MRVVSILGYLFIRALHATLRVRHVNEEKLAGEPRYILAFWHRHVLLSLHSRWRRPTTAIISRSKDGEIVARVLHLYGAETARGSSTRGGEVALREILRDIRAGKNIAVTPDGPRGPAGVVKDGVIYMAKVSGLPIVPFAFAAKKKRLLRSWDRMVFPMPFSRALYLYGDPILVPRDGEIEEWRRKLETSMHELADSAERLVNE